MANAARHGRVPDMGWHLSKDGTQLFTEGTMVALKDVCGRLLGFSKVVLHVTARKQQENALFRSEARLQALVDSSSDVLYSMSADWSEMLQLGGFDFIANTTTADKNWLEKCIHPEDQPEVRRAIRHAIETKSVFELEHRVERAEGRLGWIHM